MFKTVLLAEADIPTARRHDQAGDILPDAAVSGLYYGRISAASIDFGRPGLSSLSQAARQAGLSVDLTVIDMSDDASGLVAHMARIACSGTVLVAQGGIVTKRQLRAAAAAIEADGGAIIGAVLVNPCPVLWL